LSPQDPMELCGQLGLCSSASALPLHTLLTEKVTQVLSTFRDGEGTTPLCEMCQFAVKVAESLLENNVTEEQLVNDIEKVCYMLPHRVIGQCKDFVDSYGKAVVIMLLEATDPVAICTMLRCCPRSGDAHQDEPRRWAAVLEQLAVGAGSFCNVCQIVITYFDNELLKNETLAELRDMLEKGCELLPAPLTGKCEALVVQYEPEAVRLLVQMMDPNFVCTKIRACDSPGEDLLGSDPCAWGPQYWCKNMATAVECQASVACVPSPGS
ncbi:SAP protein, partial [Bucorvus abyssinicus]|nr:SAP protein [Bucorvus abyssinicus]